MRQKVEETPRFETKVWRRRPLFETKRWRRRHFSRQKVEETPLFEIKGGGHFLRQKVEETPLYETKGGGDACEHLRLGANMGEVEEPQLGLLAPRHHVRRVG